MRYVQILIPEGKRDVILQELDNEHIDYAVTEETGRHGYTALVSFPVPVSAVEPVLERLRRAGVEETAFTIVQKPETVVSHRFQDLKQRYQKDEIAREELVARAEEMAPAMSTYLIMAAVSSIIAATGLLQNSDAVIIGAMLVAPLMGPAMAASVGTVVANKEMAYRGVRLQVIGIALAIIAAALFAGVVKGTALIPPGTDIANIPAVKARLAPNFLSLIVAIGAGIAAVVSLARGVSGVMVGAMIAVALVPPAATVGLGLAWGEPLIMVGAGVLLLINAVAINMVALIALRALGFGPESVLETANVRVATIRRMFALTVMLVVLSVFLAFVTDVSYKVAVFEHKAKRATRNALKESQYDKMNLLEVSIKMRVVEVLFFGEEPEIIALVDRRAGRRFPDLAQVIDREIQSETNRDVHVQVRFIEAEES